MDTRIPTKYALFMQFGILSSEEVKRMSVAEINNDIGIDNRTKQPTLGGIHDPHMGTMDRGQECRTCNSDYNDCPGHFGHINLAQPVFHPGYVNMINKILRCVCFNCHKLLWRVKGTEKKLRDRVRRIPSAHMRWKIVFQACSKIKEC